jgi:hypothetical protein
MITPEARTAFSPEEATDAHWHGARCERASLTTHLFFAFDFFSVSGWAIKTIHFFNTSMDGPRGPLVRVCVCIGGGLICDPKHCGW